MSEQGENVVLSTEDKEKNTNDLIRAILLMPPRSKTRLIELSNLAKNTEGKYLDNAIALYEEAVRQKILEAAKYENPTGGKKKKRKTLKKRKTKKNKKKKSRKTKSKK